MVVRYKRLCDVKKKYVLSRIKKCIAEIEKEYTHSQIKYYWRSDSLSYDLAVFGHSIERYWDDYDIYYKAGQIVEFKHHVFNDHDMNKKELYRIMKDLHIPFDFWMTLDYKRALWRDKHYDKYDAWSREHNIEARFIKLFRLFLYNNKGKIYRKLHKYSKIM